EVDAHPLFDGELPMQGAGNVSPLPILYAPARSGNRVANEETTRLVSFLRLSGIVRPEHGFLQVRNRIYARVFNQRWVTAHMPDAELRRQQAAYHRGLWRAAVISGSVLVVMLCLVFAAVHQTNLARTKTQQAQ